MITRRVVIGRGGAALAALPLLAAPAFAAPPKSGPKSGAASRAAPPARKPATYTVTIAYGELAYGVLPTGLRVGDTIEWINNDIFVHTVTASDKSFDIVLKVKAHGRLVLAKAGDIAIHCRYHPHMKGVLKVAA